MPKQGERTWSDEQLREAVASSTTYIEVIRRLALPLNARSHIQIRERIGVLALDTRHFVVRARPFTDDELRRIAPTCTSYRMVVERLGLDVTEANTTRVRRRMGMTGIDASHFHRRRIASSRAARWSDDALRAAVASANGFAATIRALGLVPAGGNYVHVQRRIRELGIDTAHFRGQGWNAGQKQTWRMPSPLEDLLVAGRVTSSHRL